MKLQGIKTLRLFVFWGGAMQMTRAEVLAEASLPWDSLKRAI